MCTSANVGNDRLFYPPRIDESGAVVQASERVWGGGDTNGTCADFTSSLASDEGAYGDPSMTTNLWYRAGFFG